MSTKSKSKPEPMPVLAYSADVAPPAGLDPRTYRATLIVDRHDGEPLSKPECQHIAEAMPPAPKKKTVRKPAAARTAKTR